MLARIQEASGIDFGVRDLRIRVRPDGASMEGRLYYRRPRRNPEAASIKLDLSMREAVVRPPVLRPISHAYPDSLPAPATVRCYSFALQHAGRQRSELARRPFCPARRRSSDVPEDLTRLLTSGSSEFD